MTARQIVRQAAPLHAIFEAFGSHEIEGVMAWTDATDIALDLLCDRAPDYSEDDEILDLIATRVHEVYQEWSGHGGAA